MLVYHPAFDIYHGVFRALLLLNSAPTKSMHFDTLRIVDLYFVFPYLLADFEFPQGAGAKGRKLAGARSRFNTLPSPRIFLGQMKGIHMLVASAIEGRELISSAALKQGVMERTPNEIPVDLLQQATPADIELAEFLGQKISTIPLLGKRGLKDRSKLMEFRYDPA